MSLHEDVLTALRARAPKDPSLYRSDPYFGVSRPSYGLKTPELRAILTAFLKAHKGLQASELLDLVDSLMLGVTHDEKKLAAYLLGRTREVRKLVDVSHLDRWLDHLDGWCEVDSLCQNVFTAAEVLDDWPAWNTFLAALAVAPRMSKRRAALVLLVGPTTKSKDERLHAAARRAIESTWSESDPLITKAISWLLRSMAVSRRSETLDFLERNADSLPRIAVRETRRKLELPLK